ncbi:MAG: tRNA 2-thiocytidine biosynthesis TtcA family protein [Chlamydiota bacterium]
MFTIPKPPWTLLGKTLESKVRKALFTFDLLAGVDRLAIALSGGKDSLTLLFLLHAILGRGVKPVPLVAIHVSGEFSCGSSVNKQMLSSMCEELGVPLFLETSEQKADSLRCYSCSRERRRLLFERAKKEQCSHIAFGHHKDDATETLLLNMLHKAEFASMLPKVPMKKYGITILRPLIFLEEKEILRFATKENFLRTTCKCPRGALSQRNKTRQILEYMERSFPRARSNLFLAGSQYGSKKALSP